MPRTRKSLVETHEVSFTISIEAEPHLNRIIDRLVAKFPDIDVMSARMDLCATHANGCPMDFSRLAEADDLNFFHDVFGIERHLDRSTGRLLNSFHPRFAAKESA